jgi:alpha-1,6-mannosyltransferase
MSKRHAISLAAITLSIALYVWIGYFTQRNNFLQLFLIYLCLFILYVFFLYNKHTFKDYRFIIAVALLFRLSLFLMTPNLTDDYFRYIWDGLLVTKWINPYILNPMQLIALPHDISGISLPLYEHLNSPEYYSVYPPVCQYIFGFSVKLGGNDITANVLLFRLLILLFEYGSLVLIYKISKLLKAPASSISIYALNPLVIIELTGNLHAEAFMIFFILLAFYLLIKGRQIYSAVAFGVAVGVKLIPLILLPLLIIKLGPSKSLRYCSISAATVLLLFLPFFNIQAISHFISSLSLYFKVFEFNASFYYIARWIGYQITGYNTIAIGGMLLGSISLLIILFIVWRNKLVDREALFTSAIFCLTVYLLFATTVHPWYLTTLIALSTWTKFRYLLVWSFFIILSYSAYQTIPYSENLFLVAIEYIALFAWIAFELIGKRAGKQLNCSTNE